MDFSQTLAEKIDMITKKWVEAVRLDRKISSANHLSGSAIRDHLPEVLRAMASALSHEQESDLEIIVKDSSFHGVVRAAQGYTPTEIVREYRLLREIIFSSLEPDLQNGTVPEVIRAYNMINATIDEAISQCFKSYVDQRLQELQQLQNQAELTNQELSRLVKSHQDNLSLLAHELKNPLNSIIGYTELFLRSHNKKTEVRDTVPNLEHIERVLRNGRQLLRLINDTLEISRYSAGKIKLSLEPTNVPSLIKNVVELLEPLANEKQLQLVVDCDRAPETVVTDTLRLQQIITNLLSNAIRYTNTGIIELNCQKLSAHHWSIKFTDTGVGIAPEDQIHIFEPFFQAKNSDTPWYNGTGLGLAIVSQLVNLMEGKIELTSELGVGSTFTVILPLEVSFMKKAT
ncbi:MAG: sensor histidine kinase [Phormidium sp.]